MSEGNLEEFVGKLNLKEGHIQVDVFKTKLCGIGGLLC